MEAKVAMGKAVHYIVQSIILVGSFMPKIYHLKFKLIF